MAVDLILTGGQVVTPYGVKRMDIAIHESHIVALGTEASLGIAHRRVDVTDKVIVPGMVDAHVHLEDEFFGGTKMISTFAGGTRAAALSGITTIIDFAFQLPGSSLHESLAARKALAEGKTAIDYAFHVGVSTVDDDILGEVQTLIAHGHPSFKVFTIYPGRTVTDGPLFDLMQVVGKHGGLVAVHAENASIADYRVAKYLKHGQTGPIYHARSKPNIVEAEVIQRVMYLAKHAGAAVYFMHVSTREGVELIRAARQAAQPVYGESCTHYLVLTEDAYKGENGHLWIISPPLRREEDQKSLWKSLADGILSSVSSDESSWSHRDKDAKRARFDQVPNGAPGIGVRTPVLISEGVNKNRIDWETFVALTSTNAARIFGLYPRKGVIAIGSDADLAVIDPNVSWSLTLDSLQMEADWCVLPNFDVTGKVVMTVLRGQTIVEEGDYVGVPNHGQYLSRKLCPDVLHRPVL